MYPLIFDTEVQLTLRLEEDSIVTDRLGGGDKAAIKITDKTKFIILMIVMSKSIVKNYTLTHLVMCNFQFQFLHSQ